MDLVQYLTAFLCIRHQHIFCTTITLCEFQQCFNRLTNRAQDLLHLTMAGFMALIGLTENLYPIGQQLSGIHLLISINLPYQFRIFSLCYVIAPQNIITTVPRLVMRIRTPMVRKSARGILKDKTKYFSPAQRILLREEPL